MDRHSDATRQAPLWISIVSVTLIVGAVAAALAALQRLPADGLGGSDQGALSRGIVLNTSYDIAGLTQPEGVAFSPNGAYIAMLGDFTPCAPPLHQLTPCGHGLAVFDASTGDLVRLAPIETWLGIPASSASSRTGNYVSLYGLGWTPDSAWYGLIYSVFNTPTPSIPDDLQYSGLLLINPSSGVGSVIRGDSAYFASHGNLSADHPTWDRARLSQLPPASIIPSLLYSWASSDAPQALDAASTPITHLPANAGPFAPVGNPDGTGPFTIWQPGVLVGPGSSGLSGQRSAFLTTFPAWSDSGKRVGVFTAGVSLPTPAGALATVSAPASVGTPHVPFPDALIAAPPRDMALTRVQQAVGAFGWAQIAWSPDGAILASITCFAHQGEAIELRDALSGALLGRASLALSANDPGCRDLAQAQKLGAYPHPNLTIAWSPDGRQLVLADKSAATLTFWHVTSSR